MYPPDYISFGLETGLSDDVREHGMTLPEGLKLQLVFAALTTPQNLLLCKNNETNLSSR